MTTAQALSSRRRHSRRGHFIRTPGQSAERPYAPSREALTFKPSEVSVSVGPAGLACAEHLGRQGHSVAIFDAWPLPGGLLVYGIPSFKLDKSIIDAKATQLVDRLPAR